jgi:DNA polymerase-3 subunit epsilon
MRLAGGGRLAVCCSEYKVEYNGTPHSAINDARATARLLSLLLADAPGQVREVSGRPPISWPSVPKGSSDPLSRGAHTGPHYVPQSYLERLLARPESFGVDDPEDPAATAYMAALDRALEDRRIEEHEADALIEAATRWGFSPTGIRSLHDRYLRGLVAAAVADGVVTVTERRDLQRVSALLGIDGQSLDAMLKEAAGSEGSQTLTSTGPAVESSVQEPLAGKRVCFTGECCCTHNGATITREKAGELASQHGLTVAETVTKKLDILVVADPHTESGKAKKARQYGIRIMHEPVFWAALGVAVS